MKKKSSQMPLFDLFSPPSNEPPVQSDLPPVCDSIDAVVPQAIINNGEPVKADNIAESANDLVAEAQDCVVVEEPDIILTGELEVILEDTATGDAGLTFFAEDEEAVSPEFEVAEDFPLENSISDQSDIYDHFVYELYVSDTCPNCVEVKSFVAENLIEGMGRVFNLSTDDESLVFAKKRSVYELPAFLIINAANDAVIARANNLKEIVNILQKTVNYVPSVADIRDLID